MPQGSHRTWVTWDIIVVYNNLFFSFIFKHAGRLKESSLQHLDLMMTSFMACLVINFSIALGANLLSSFNECLLHEGCAWILTSRTWPNFLHLCAWGFMRSKNSFCSLSVHMSVGWVWESISYHGRYEAEKEEVLSLVSYFQQWDFTSQGSHLLQK